MPQEIQSNAGAVGLAGQIEQLGKLVGLSTATLLILSTFYDFSYLYALGLSFEDVPSSVSDHVRSALVWSPRVAIYTLVLVVYEMSMRIIENGLPEDELIARSSNPRFTRAFRKGPPVLFGCIALIVFGGHFLLSTSSYALYLGAIAAWGFTSLAIVNHPRLGSRFGTSSGRLFVILPIVAIWVGSLGYVQGERLLDEKKARWSVLLKTEQGSERRELLGLRRFSTAAVLIGPNRDVSVIPNESILHARLLLSLPPEPPRICKWFGMGCQP